MALFISAPYSGKDAKAENLPQAHPYETKEAPRMSTNGSTNATICEIDAGLMKEIRKFRFSREVKNRALVMKVCIE